MCSSLLNTEIASVLCTARRENVGDGVNWDKTASAGLVMQMVPVEFDDAAAVAVVLTLLEFVKLVVFNAYRGALSARIACVASAAGIFESAPPRQPSLPRNTPSQPT
jgi:hypothetical protein